ncbi:MAG: exodeoxyribonuclease III [Clostridia bacterium]|nr:exodeoxyribonuclease III [Clostridia bacterium]
MKLVSWNVNGIRACLSKGFEDFFHRVDADIFSIQESKMQESQGDISFEGYTKIWNSAEKKGYSGTVTYSKKKPLSVAFGVDGKHTNEGRLITLEFENFYLINCYTPNAQPELARLEYRLEFEEDLRFYMANLSKTKPVILCGDLNVAHNEIDLKNPKPNIGNPGFSYEERSCFSALLGAGFVDSFRYLYPDKRDAYSWWSYRANARANNTGWRIDYFVVSENVKGKIKDSVIYADVYGSDHCPVGLEIDLEF